MVTEKRAVKVFKDGVFKIYKEMEVKPGDPHDEERLDGVKRAAKRIFPDKEVKVESPGRNEEYLFEASACV